MKQHYFRTNSDGSIERQIFNGHPGRCLPLWFLDEEENRKNPVKQNPNHGIDEAPAVAFVRSEKKRKPAKKKAKR